MGTKFVGSDDETIFPSQAVTVVGSPVTGPWVELQEAEHYEFEITNTTGTVTAAIQTDAGATPFEAIAALAAGTPEILSMGGLPGGRRVRAVVTASVDATGVVVTAKETRSGLG